MSSPDDESFHKLTSQLHQQYVVLDQIIESLGGKSVDSVSAIAEQLNAIKCTEAELLPLRNDFLASGRSLTAELQTATDETIALVVGLMPKLAQLEQATMKSVSRLFPQVQDSVRAVQMQNAYGR